MRFSEVDALSREVERLSKAICVIRDNVSKVTADDVPREAPSVGIPTNSEIERVRSSLSYEIGRLEELSTRIVA